MIADEMAVIGFPMSGGVDNIAAVVLRHSSVVEAVANVFTQLWSDPTTHLLFRGRANFPELERTDLVQRVQRLLTESTPPHPP
jgi:hypothetical protein